MVEAANPQEREPAEKRARVASPSTPAGSSSTTGPISSSRPAPAAPPEASSTAGIGDEGEALTATPAADNDDELPMMSEDERHNGDDNSMPDDDNDGNVSDFESEYDYESDGEMGTSSTEGMDLANEDADALRMGLGGMFAKVEAHSSTLLRLWVCVEHWRLFEGLAQRTVEALGLDPLKDVMVMLTTDQEYRGPERLKVKWARQVDPGTSNGDHLPADGSIGEMFALQGTLCHRIDEELANMWPRFVNRPPAGRETSGQRRGGNGNGNEPSLRTGGAQGLGDQVSKQDLTASPALDPARAAAGSVGEARVGAMAGAVADGPDDLALHWAIVSICEFTGASPELAAYALQVFKYDQEQTHLNLMDGERRSSLEGAFREFKATKKALFPLVDEATGQGSIAAHPRSVALQSSFLRDGASGKWQAPADVDGRNAPLEKLSETNPLARVALTIMDKLRNANKNCLVCDEPIEGFLPAVPIVCPKEFCRWRSEQMGSGIDVESQVMKKGETVNLLIDLFWMAMNSSRSELAFPNTVQSGTELVFKHPSGANDVDKVRSVLNAFPSVADMQRCIERKRGVHRREETPPSRDDPASSRSGQPQWSAGAAANAAKNAEAIVENAKKAKADAERVAIEAADADAAAAVAEAEAAGAATAGDRASATAVATAARAHASMMTVKSASTAASAQNAAKGAALAIAQAVKAGCDVAAASWGNFCEPGRNTAEEDHATAKVLSLERKLSEKNPLSYRLLRWLLSANRAHLRPLRGSELIREISCEKQFTLVTGTAEREAKFQSMKWEASALSEGGRGTGSFYAFHGSGAGNWHGILQMGLKNMSGSKWMSSGAAMGSGIYMADTLSVSLGYAGRGGVGNWPLAARTSGVTNVIVAVCEVIDRESYKIPGRGSGYYVVPDEECVATRFLLINPSSSNGTVKASSLAINLQT